MFPATVPQCCEGLKSLFIWQPGFGCICVIICVVGCFSIFIHWSVNVMQSKTDNLNSICYLRFFYNTVCDTYELIYTYMYMYVTECVCAYYSVCFWYVYSLYPLFSASVYIQICSKVCEFADICIDRPMVPPFLVKALENPLCDTLFLNQIYSVL